LVASTIGVITTFTATSGTHRQSDGRECENEDGTRYLPKARGAVVCEVISVFYKHSDCLQLRGTHDASTCTCSVCSHLRQVRRETGLNCFCSCLCKGVRCASAFHSVSIPADFLAHKEEASYVSGVAFWVSFWHTPPRMRTPRIATERYCSKED
jgi:hypothetical protein